MTSDSEQQKAEGIKLIDMIGRYVWEPETNAVSHSGYAVFFPAAFAVVFSVVSVALASFIHPSSDTVSPSVEKAKTSSIPLEQSGSILAVIRRPSGPDVDKLEALFQNGKKVTLVCSLPPEGVDRPELSASFPVLEAPLEYFTQDGFLLNDFQWFPYSQ